MLQAEVLIFELVSVDRLSSSAISSSEVASLPKAQESSPIQLSKVLVWHLAHEVGNDPVEGGPLEPKALLTGAQRAKVLAGLRHHVKAKLRESTINVVKVH